MISHPVLHYIITANWQDSGASIQDLIIPFATRDNFAILYNTDPENDKLYIATIESRIIEALSTKFTMTETEPIDYARDFMHAGNSPWELKGKPELVNFQS